MKKSVVISSVLWKIVAMLFLVSPLSPIGNRLCAQDAGITIKLENQTIRSGFDAIEKQSKYIFFYDDALRPLLTKRVTLSISSASIQAVMNRLLESSGLTYRIVNKQILISRTNVSTPQQEEQKKGITLTGKVTDENRLPLPGVNVYVLSLQRITTTDVNGAYSLQIPPTDEPVLLRFSFVGMKTVEFLIEEKEGMLVKNVQLFPDGQLAEVIVTGIFDRKAESFSGASTTINSKDLMRVGNQNLIESLKALDPTLYVPDNFTMGSDPNSLPTLSMRGTSSFPLTETSTLKSNYQNQPNQPLIILDGFESSIEYMVDMDMNRVESVTILKDASAKALYGSKAANGVIVIETKRLSGNEQRVSYNGSASFELPDLTSYDLTNALEKLEVEMAEGVYYSNDPETQVENMRLYNSRKKQALEGLNTYWLSKPLRAGVGQKHNVSVELGDSRSLRAILDVTSNQVNGVMKGSQRRNISGSANVSYRTNNFLFKNILSIISNKGEDSPYGNFSTYARMNPYLKATDAQGNVLRWADIEEKIPNPMYDATIGTSFTSSYLQFINNFYSEWRITPDWKATLRVGVSGKRNDSDSFFPVLHSLFASVSTTSSSEDERLLRRGRYLMENGKSNSVSGDLNINYNKTFGKHSLFTNAGASVSESQYRAYLHVAEGFMNNQVADITFARQYAEGVTPVGESSINRQATFLLVGQYDYDSRYFADATIQESASSLYGANNRWANNWSFGLGWNMHNESFVKNLQFIDLLKLRASIGMTGNQNFNTNEAIGTYKYYTGVVYGLFPGAYINNMPNPKLKWEQKKDRNMGVDVRMAGLSLSLDYYVSNTENMLTNVTIPTSTGFAMVKDNLGLVQNRGIEAKANYAVWRGNRGFVNVFGSFVHDKNEIISLSESMREHNERMKSLAEDVGNSAPVLIYEDGYSMNTIWAVPSAGIDPNTGREVYIKKDGSYTYRYDAADLVAAGNSHPKYRGNAGFTAEYNGIGVSTTLTFLGGSQMYNYTLVDRVENADIGYNVDRRVLLGRWQRPGQVTQFKKFNAKETTLLTTRFVQDRNELNISSISAYYEFPASTYEKLHMKRLRLSVYMNNVATFSSIKVERGLTYPFARTLSVQLTGTF